MNNSLSETSSSAQTSPQDVRHMVTIEVGQRLQLAREEQGLSLESISDQIKLSKIQLNALENGDWQDLPNDTFALAFLRQYAQHLNIDIKNTVEQLKSDALSFHQPLTFPDPAIAPNRKWAIAAAVLFILLLITWNLRGSSTTPSKLPPPVVDKAQQPTVAPTIKTPVTTVKKADDNTKTQPPASKAVKPVKTIENATPVPSVKTTPPAVTAIAVNKPVAVEKTPQAVTLHIIEKKKPQPITPPTIENKTPPSIAVIPHEFSFHAANERVWLLIEAPDGKGGRKRLREVIVRPGHSIEIVRKNPVLFVSVGNAGGIKVTFEGKTLYDFGQLGARGMVIRHHEIRAVPNKPITPKKSSKPALR